MKAAAKYGGTGIGGEKNGSKKPQEANGDKNDHNENAKTGDTSGLAARVILPASCGILLALLFAALRKIE